MWDTIKMTLPSKPNDQPPSFPKINGSNIENLKLISDHYNNHFCTIWSKLADRVEEQPEQDPLQFIQTSISNSFFL